jgi:hypothetical protein
MRHTIEYNGERKTVDAKSTATIVEVADIAFGPLPSAEYSKVICHGSGKHADSNASVRQADYAVIARAIYMNCDQLAAGEIDQATWKANQNALWAEAARQHVMSDVMRLVAPSLGAK